MRESYNVRFSRKHANRGKLIEEKKVDVMKKFLFSRQLIAVRH